MNTSDKKHKIDTAIDKTQDAADKIADHAIDAAAPPARKITDAGPSAGKSGMPGDGGNAIHSSPQRCACASSPRSTSPRSTGTQAMGLPQVPTM